MDLTIVTTDTKAPEVIPTPTETIAEPLLVPQNNALETGVLLGSLEERVKALESRVPNVETTADVALEMASTATTEAVKATETAEAAGAIAVTALTETVEAEKETPSESLVEIDVPVEGDIPTTAPVNGAPKRSGIKTFLFG